MPAATSSLFDSFWLAGFECACHINQAGQRLDMLATTQHDVQAAVDYARLRARGIRTARDGVRWPLIEQRGRYDFSSLAPMLEAAQRARVQVIWDLCHYGWPNDLDVFAPAFVERLARFCGATARFIADHSAGVPFFTPMNEISFLSWAAGDMGYIYPGTQGRGHELKRQLVRATIASIEAIWATTPAARIVLQDPVIYIVPPREQPELAPSIAEYVSSQFEAWDMLAGRVHPDLGGAPRYLDIIGVSYYFDNQWEHNRGPLRWEAGQRDPRRVPLSYLLHNVYRRYQRPLFVGETGHFGAGRAPWLRQIAAEVQQARHEGVPVEGVCLYPILDRPGWDNPTHWHNAGLWDLVPEASGRLQRVLNVEYALELERVMRAP